MHDKLKDIEEHFTGLLRALGDDPDREGLKETPARAAKAWCSASKGIGIPEEQIISQVKTFAEPSSVGEIITVGGLNFSSTCEHHLLPFHGVCHVAYIPNDRGKVAGLSKIPRVLDLLAKRLQIQERLTAQLFGVLEKALNPKALLVWVRATHHCLTFRGVNKPSSTTATLKFGGSFTDPAVRATAMSLFPPERIAA